jgi:Flp pilus assembly secretin CpaC
MNTCKLISKWLIYTFLFTGLFGSGTLAVARPVAHLHSVEQEDRPRFQESLERAPLYLEIGEQRVLHFQGLQKYSVSGKSIHYSRLPHRDELMVKAVSAGNATLSVFTASGNESRLIRIEQAKSFKRPAGLLQAIGRLRSVEVIDEGEHFLLRGKVEDPSDARSIAYLTDHYSPYVLNETYLPEVEVQSAHQKLATLLSNYPTVELESADGTLAVTGGLPTASQLQVLTTRIRAIAPLTQIEVTVIKNSNPTIYFKVYLLEVKKELLRHIGTDWSTPLPGVLQLAPVKFMVENTIELSIQALSEKKLLRVLSSPELVVRAPGQAELFAGGELPIRQRSKFSDSLTWKQFGLSLKLDVTEFGGEKVRLNIETEMSHVDHDEVTDGTPAIQANRMKTQVDAVMGKPLFLSGLVQEELKSRSSGIAGLSEIPILGKLFGSEDYKHDRSELVAILVPYRSGPEHPMQRIASDTPRGYLPLPRTPDDGFEKEEIKKSSDFPWNFL